MADTIKIGNLDISAFKVGSSDCKVYLGDTLLYPTTPPTPTFKWIATYTGGTTSSAECDSTSAITRNEITLTDLVSAQIGYCVTTIGNSVFGWCNGLTSCTIGSGVTTIGHYAFTNCTGLTSIDIPNSVTSISGSAFQGCSSLTSIDIPSGVTSIGASTFSGCTSLTSIDIPDSVTTIDYYAFERCTSLTSVTIGTGITRINEDAFRYCSGLTSITVNATTPPTLETYSVFGSTNDCVIYVPFESVDSYKTTGYWSNYARRIQALPTPTPQWVTFSNGDTIPSDLQIYGIKGTVNDLSYAFVGFEDDIYVEDAGRNKYNAIFGGFDNPCYSEYDILSNTSVEYIFSNVGCSDSYTVSSKTIADMSNDIQLYIYA